MIPNIFEFYSLILISLSCYILTYLSVYNYKLSLSQLNVFNRKPFTCWLCSNWWLSWFCYITLAYIVTPWYLLWGGIFTCMTTYIIYDDPNP